MPKAYSGTAANATEQLKPITAADNFGSWNMPSANSQFRPGSWDGTMMTGGKWMRRERPFSVSYYRQIANLLRARITSADGSDAVRLESERDLSVLHGVSRVTIRKALEILQAEGLIERMHGSATRTIPAAIQRYKQLRRSRSIHIVTSWLALTGTPTTFYGQIYQGTLAAITKAGYLSTTQQLPGGRGTQLRSGVYAPAPDQTVGAVLVGITDESIIQMFADADYPIVCVDYWTNNPKADALVIDCFGEGQLAIQHLLRLGHRNIFFLGHVHDHGEREADCELFLAGTQRGMLLANLPPIPAEFIRFCPGASETERTVQWFMSLQPRPTAGLIFQIKVLETVAAALRARGIRCPEDVSLVGRCWDGYPTKATCLQNNPKSLGKLAVECVLHRATGQRKEPLRLATLSKLYRGQTVRLQPENTSVSRGSPQPHPSLLKDN